MAFRRLFFFSGIVAILSLTWISYQSLAEESVKLHSSAYAYKVVWQNDRVTVMEARLGPGDKIPMHFHPDHVVYINSPGKLRFAFPEAPPLVSETKIGEVYWGPAGQNSTENIGQTEVNATVVELKEAGTMKGSKGTTLSQPPLCPL